MLKYIKLQKTIVNYLKKYLHLFYCLLKKYLILKNYIYTLFFLDITTKNTLI